MASSQYYLVSLWRKLVSVAAHQCAALTCRAVCRRADIVASFKLPSVDVRLGANEAPGMLSVWCCRILVTKGRTLKIRQRMNTVVQMCSMLLLIACCGRIVSLYWVGRLLCFVSNVFCTSCASALNLRFDLILGGGGWSELVRVVAH